MAYADEEAPPSRGTRKLPPASQLLGQQEPWDKAAGAKQAKPKAQPKLAAKKLAEDIGESAAQRPAPKARAKAPARKVPDEGPSSKKPRIRKVAITLPVEKTLTKRGRGRPKGAVGKKKRDLLAQQALEASMLVGP